jgi:hypothetical protein
MIVMIAWNPLGFLLIKSLPKGKTFHAEYYRDHILAVLIPLRPDTGGRKHGLRAYDASAHTVQEHQAFCAQNALWLATHLHTRLISRHQTSFSSGMSAIVYRERSFHHMENYVQRLRY